MSEPETSAYGRFLDGVKERIRSGQVKASLAANAELVLLFWDLGRAILEQQRAQGWGAKVIDRLSGDLKSTFPELKGFSVRNLKYMRKFAEEWPDAEMVQQLAAQIPWGHHCVLLDKVPGAEARAFYIAQSCEHGWSRASLVHQIESGLLDRQGKAPTNFVRTLPAPQSELARELLKDPYVLKPAALDPSARERDLEAALIARLRDFLLELGSGFAFLGNQYPLTVDGEDFYLDLLFYHTRLHCYVVVDLKVVDFRPEFAGKMSFYQSAVDSALKSPQDHPTIGIILCKGKNNTVVEYTLRDMRSPIGVAEYRLLPPNLKGKLPGPQKIRKLVNEPES
jgi:predicted nuclease of restriction endonuclease-like (RecB) superfamily